MNRMIIALLAVGAAGLVLATQAPPTHTEHLTLLDQPTIKPPFTLDDHADLTEERASRSKPAETTTTTEAPTTTTEPPPPPTTVPTTSLPRPAPVVTTTPVVQPEHIVTSSSGLNWEALRQCESGGNYANKNNPTYRGAYQFSYGTWASMGGSGDPADASPAEQDMRAQMLYNQSGPGQWPVCGRRL